jgi:hypothetical protein
VRYFDLRPKLLDDNTIVAHHSGNEGGPFTEIVGDVRRFMDETDEGKKTVELVILHFGDYCPKNDNDPKRNQTLRDRLRAMISDNLHDYLYTGVRRGGKRLARLPLSDFIGEHGCVLPVFDPPFEPDTANSGLFVLSRWADQNPTKGDFTLFDVWTHTKNLQEMACGHPNGQIPAFNRFQGHCLHTDPITRKNVLCDFFLMQWILTPDPDNNVWAVSRWANGALCGYLSDKGPNEYCRIINMIYADFCEYSRVFDLILEMNGLRESPMRTVTVSE